jgi:hypothetical protein
MSFVKKLSDVALSKVCVGENFDIKLLNVHYFN